MTFQKYKDARGQWRWRLRAGNHKIIATASEGYVKEADCDHAIKLVKESAGASIKKDT